jgi:single-stranded-DNA-specific exonuclease
MLIEPSVAALAKLSSILAEAHAMTKSLHRRILVQAHEHADRLHLRDELVMVIGQRGWHPGVMGPVAAQLAERFTRPAIAVALDGAVGVGSGRSVPGFDLFSALRSCEGFLVRYGGHAQACGLTIHAEELPRFRDAINRHARTRAAGEALAGPMAVDLDVTIADLNAGLAEAIERLKPFGTGNRPPLVLIRQAACVRDEQAGWLADATGRIRLAGRLRGLAPDERYDILAEPSFVNGRGSVSVVDVMLTAEGEAAPSR